MNIKLKLALMYPLIGWRNHRARRLAKKASRDEMSERYPVQWRNDLVIKRCNQMLKVLKIKLNVIGYENIPKQASLLIANHMSSFDPVVLLAALRNPGHTPDDVNQRVIFIAKEELKKNKRLKGYANLINTFYIKRQNPREALAIINEAVEESKNSKRHLMIFPEGTRSKDGVMQDFKGGAFRIAKKAYYPIVPITINNTLSISNLNRKGKLEVEIIFHKPIKPMSFMSSENQGIANRVQKIIQTRLRKPEGKRSEMEQKLA